jgi:3-dehydrosphinganine reductase
MKLGGSACIIARTLEPLLEAEKELKQLIHHQTQFVEHIQADTTDMSTLKPLLDNFIKEHGVLDYLIQCVGYAYPQYIEKLKIEDFQKNMNVNFYGLVVPILCLLPHFINAGKGHIANVSSIMGYMGIMGYATYAPSKFAIVGLTEVLRNELKPRGLTFSILYPPDTNTPGFATENQSKPPECSIMSEGAKILQPKQVAITFIKGILKKQLYIFPGESKMVQWIFRHFPRIVHKNIDGSYAKARKQTQKNHVL